MSEHRAKVAERMMGEILEYVFEQYLPRAELTTFDQLGEVDRKMTAALGAFERGEISYADLEAIGTEYVEAWEGAVGANISS